MNEHNAQAAHDEILQRCRATGIGGWVMRDLPGGDLAVLSFRESEPIPGGYSWQRQPRRISIGTTWGAVLDGLPS